jgi:hypothetical protein
MVMKASDPKEGHRAVVTGIDTIGVAIGYEKTASGYLIAGWENRRKIDIIDPNTSLRLEWPSNDFFNVRVGTEWPHGFEETKPKPGGVSNEP